MLCETCVNFLGMNYSGEKVRCKTRGTKRPRAWKCKAYREGAPLLAIEQAWRQIQTRGTAVVELIPGKEPRLITWSEEEVLKAVFKK